MKVSLRVKQVLSIEVAGYLPPKMFVDVEMTGDQCKDAILDLINHDGEQHVFEWFKEEFPEWFEVKA